MRPFSVYRRASAIYYAELFDGRGIRIGSRSTNKRKRDEAVLVAHRWTERASRAKRGSPPASRVLHIKITAPDFSIYEKAYLRNIPIVSIDIRKSDDG
jgi:hypothetical protein